MVLSFPFCYIIFVWRRQNTTRKSIISYLDVFIFSFNEPVLEVTATPQVDEYLRNEATGNKSFQRENFLFSLLYEFRAIKKDGRRNTCEKSWFNINKK